MSAAFVISACVAVLQTGIGVLLVIVSLAPGWRSARAHALVAFSAAAYSVSNLAASLAPISDATRTLSAQFSYLVAGIFVAACLLGAYGGPTASPRMLPRWCKGLIAILLFGGVLAFVARPWFFSGAFIDVRVAWSGVHYRFPAPAPLAEAVSYVNVLGVLLTCAEYWRPRGPHRRVSVPYVVGFSIFLVTALVETLVANGTIEFLFVAELGFLAVVISTAIETAKRFIDDARRLSVASGYLTEEIDRRTEERDEAQRAWMEAERQAALGRLAAGVGHEINNPLTYLRLNIELMQAWGRENGAPEDLMESADSALDGADRIRGVVDALRAYSRPTTGTLMPISPELFTQAAIRVTSHKLRGVAEVRTRIERAPEVMGDEGRLVQAMVNLLLNAAQSIPKRRPGEAGTVEVRVGTAIDGHALLEVRDDGPGLSREEVKRLAQPYFSTRFEAGGVGLGLFLARGVVEQMGGLLEIESELGVGTLVRILLPPAQPVAQSALDGVVGRVRSLTSPGGVRVSSARVPAIRR